MATLRTLVTNGELVALRVPLERNEFPDRQIYALPRVRKWLEDQLPGQPSDRFVEIEPEGQLEDLLHQFITGGQLCIGQTYKSMHHHGDGVWELKTADLRLFGWFYKRDIFIVSDVNLKRFVMGPGVVPGLCKQAVRFREILPLDEPKFIDGDDPHVVVSNWSYP